MYLYPFHILKKRLAEITEIKDLNWYLQQYDEGQRGRVLYNAPGVYIQFEPIQTEQLDKFTQMADSLITIHLVTDSVQDNEKRIATTHAAVMNKIYDKLHGFSAKVSYLDEFAALAGTADDKRMLNSMRRSGITPPHSFSSKVVTLQQFHSVIYDHSKNKALTQMAPGFEADGVLHPDPVDHKTAPAVYRNSDGSFRVEIQPGAEYVALDVIHIDSDGSEVPTPANEAFTAKLITDPRFAGAKLTNDNTKLIVYFSEPEYNTAIASGALEVTDFAVSIAGGTATNPVLSNIRDVYDAALAGGEIAVKFDLAVTGSADGSEVLTINPVSNSVFDADGVAMKAEQSVNVSLNPPLYDADAQLWIDRWSGLTKTMKGKINTFVVNLKATGDYAKIKEMFVRKNFGTANALIGIKTYTGAGINNPLIDASGVVFNGASAVDNSLALSTLPGIAIDNVLTHARVGAVRNLAGGDHFLYGAHSSNFSRHHILDASDGNIYVRSSGNTAAAANAVNPTAGNDYFIRAVPTKIEILENAVVIGTLNSAPSGTFPSVNMYSGDQNGQSAPSDHTEEVWMVATADLNIANYRTELNALLS